MRSNGTTLYGFAPLPGYDLDLIDHIAHGVEQHLQGKLILEDDTYYVLPNRESYGNTTECFMFVHGVCAALNVGFYQRDFPDTFIRPYYDGNGRLYE